MHASTQAVYSTQQISMVYMYMHAKHPKNISTTVHIRAAMILKLLDTGVFVFSSRW